MKTSKYFLPTVSVLLVAILAVNFLSYLQLRRSSGYISPDISPKPTAVSNHSETADQLVYRNEKAGFEFKYPKDWTVREVNNKTEICPLGYSNCFTIRSENRDYETFLKDEQKIIGMVIQPTTIFIGPEKNIKAEKSFNTFEQENFGYVFIYHNPLNLVISHNYDDFEHPLSGGAILSTFRLIDQNPTPTSIPHCLKAGEFGNYNDRNQPCCSGLEKLPSPNSKNGYYVCANCGDGQCGDGESIDNCSRDCPNNCIAEGQQGNLFEKQDCCDGLKQLACSTRNPPCSAVTNGCFVCGNCGDNHCGIGENKCNCPEDCR